MGSNDASLHGPISTSDYAQKCLTLGTDAYAISDAANGICMHSHDCAHEFCLKDQLFDLPYYVVDVRTEEDITKALNFASSKQIEVSIKTTGHSYQGSSTKADTLMIWMHNYPKDGTINHNYVDSCGTNHGPVVGISGGEIWDDVLEAVKDSYHIVTGGARTVSAAGGWLMGGGLSFSSREYGIGVDQVVNFRLVLANGTAVDANACTNQDLFWALRGGGGGTFGVVTHVQYKLHPLTTIVEVNFWYGGYDWAEKNEYDALITAIDTWFEFWIEKSVNLDSRWSGFFNIFGAHLLFAGSEDDARTTFIDDFNRWYWNDLDKSGWREGYFGALPPEVKVHSSWYDYKGGPDAAGNPDATDATGLSYSGINTMAARLMPRSVVVERPEEVKQLLLDIAGSLGFVNYFLGGKMNDVSTNETAVHPALRKSVWSIFTHSDEHGQRVREFVSNNVTGVCYNHHSAFEPDWRNACWGNNYEKLSSLKNKYDANQTFNCWHCVGYDGKEVDYDFSGAPFNPHQFQWHSFWLIAGASILSVFFVL